MTTTYTISPAPRFAGMRDWTCTRCGREEVKPVFLAENGGRPMAFGSGCAAKLLGREGAGRKVVDEAAAIQRADDARVEMVEERKARYARALVDFRADPNRETPDLASARETYHRSGGFTKLAINFPDFMAAVAATGEI